MATIAFVSFRLGGTDGVAIEVDKWTWALRSLGHRIVTVAGEGPVDRLVPGLGITDTVAPSLATLSTAFDDADVVIVENLASLPLNPGAREVLYQARAGRLTLLHHHDLPWQRDHLAHLDGPRDDPHWAHVTINALSQQQLAERGIRADVLYNHFDLTPPVGDRDRTRAALGIDREPLVLLPTRAIPRKNVAGALQLAEACGATLWILGAAEDGYDEELAHLLSGAAIPVVRGLPDGATIHDAYAACDLVVMSSTWEGFGNPVLESVTHRRPLARFPYPVALEIESLGFSFIDLTDVEGARTACTTPDHAVLEHNWRIAQRHFNLNELPGRLDELLTRNFPGLGG